MESREDWTTFFQADLFGKEINISHGFVFGKFLCFFFQVFFFKIMTFLDFSQRFKAKTKKHLSLDLQKLNSWSTYATARGVSGLEVEKHSVDCTVQSIERFSLEGLEYTHETYGCGLSKKAIKKIQNWLAATCRPN